MKLLILSALALLLAGCVVYPYYGYYGYGPGYYPYQPNYQYRHY